MGDVCNISQKIGAQVDNEWKYYLIVWSCCVHPNGIRFHYCAMRLHLLDDCAQLLTSLLGLFKLKNAIDKLDNRNESSQ